jgi:AbrB family looped-hinge helix DNA binding protein
MSDKISEKVVSVSARGQATIPKEFRDALGITTPGRVKFVRNEHGDVVVRPIQSVTELRGMLADETDEQGRSPTDQLRTERGHNDAVATDLRDQHGSEMDEHDE